MKAALLAGVAGLLIASPALAQHSGHAGHTSPSPQSPPPRDEHAGHDMPAAPSVAQEDREIHPDPHAGHDMGAMENASTASQSSPDAHAAHGMPAAPEPTPQSDPHAGHDMRAMPAQQSASDVHEGHQMGGGNIAEHHGPVGTNLPPGDAAAPSAFPGSAAGRFYGEQVMAEQVRELKQEHGGGSFSQIIFNLAEVQIKDGRESYRFDGEGWFGGDINRLVVKTEGAGDFGHAVEDAEIQLLYSRALDPYVNFQAGIRYDIKPDPSRTYASVGFEALAPYFFDVEGTLFLSDKGDVLARAEAYYDQRVTNWIVLQPRAELNFAAQDMPAEEVGSGLSDAELGLRLRYEIRRELAPYIGVSWERKFGDTARYARDEGESTGGFSFVAGVRLWF